MDSPIPLSPLSSSSSEADDKPDTKRQILSLPPGKVAVICNCGTNEGRFCYIVIIDLNSKTHVFVDDEFIRVAPTVRFKRDHYDTNGFCILGSTFYMIDSVDKNMVPPPKSVYTIDLSSYLHDDDVVTEPDLRTLEISELGKAPDMLHPKDTPYATPTPDGKKMLVLSSFITSEPSNEISGENDFELYDPDTRSWKQLPGIRYDWNDHFGHKYDRGRFWIAAFTFIGKSTFLIETATGAFTSSSSSMYAIDLESLDNGWRKCNDFYGARNTKCNNCPFFVIEEELCLTSSGVCDITKRNRVEYADWYRFPLPSYGVEFERCGPTYVVLLDDVENGQCSFCTLESGPSRETGYPHLTIDTYHCDVSRYREDKEKKGESAELRTSIAQVRLFKFLLDIDASFFPRGFFAIRADAD